jgi:magnesium chelatase family protein
MIQKYARKISGPLLDRIDLHVNVKSVKDADLSSTTMESTSEIVRQRIIKARKIQLNRSAGTVNAQMTHEQTKTHCRLGTVEQGLLIQAMEKQKLSARSYDRILKVARTAADLDGSINISHVHLAEAIAFRCFDGDYFGF